MYTCQFALSNNAHVGTSKCHFDTQARFSVPQVIKNTPLKMAENFRFAEIWSIVPTKEKYFYALHKGLKLGLG